MFLQLMKNCCDPLWSGARYDWKVKSNTWFILTETLSSGGVHGNTAGYIEVLNKPTGSNVPG